MRAIVYREYGPPEVLQLEELEKPVPADDEVLVEIRAASINPYDRHFMRGEPRAMRWMMGWRRPRCNRLGVDGAGVVAAVGRSVNAFKPGDEVFGGLRGSLAEYACTRARSLVVKPPNVTFEQAASSPIAGLTALQALRDRVHAGTKVLINGASGGVGTFAVQIARGLGADVTGVCSTRNVEMVRSIGATRVIDYTKEDFARQDARYDLVLDCVWTHKIADSKHVLEPGGKYLIVGGPPEVLIKGVAAGFATGGRVTMVMTRPTPEVLASLADLMESGKVVPVIDRSYRLDETREAMYYLETKHARGKIIITPR